MDPIAHPARRDREHAAELAGAEDTYGAAGQDH
jgi:hypothetical protein